MWWLIIYLIGYVVHYLIYREYLRGEYEDDEITNGKVLANIVMSLTSWSGVVSTLLVFTPKGLEDKFNTWSKKKW